ncbi:MAG: isoprenylcysteine carboxylmethyltransferase family protein, partial [Thermoanaerobaculia bacterium]|nr:isoprenylcysteine carboxylmethyltransferase family protein [Thermoanaerobaculia bacterium]
TIVGAISIGVALGLWQVVDRLLAWHWGYHWPLVIVGLALYVLGIVGERRIRRHLDMRVLTGVPELDADDPGELLTQGPFARSRNPRYLNLLVATLGVALILNYPILYLELLAAIPTTYLLVRLEERELADRFGAEYEAYCREVPRFLPRSGWLF